MVHRSVKLPKAIACQLTPIPLDSPAARRIRQVSGWEASLGLKGGLFLAQIGPQLAGKSASAAPS